MHRILAPLPLLLVALAGCTQRVQAPTASIALLNTRPIYPGIEADLDGQGSSDPNGEGMTLTYAWRMLSAPPGSTTTFNAGDMPVVSFVPDQYGDYTVGLSVSNGLLWSDEVTQTVTADSCGNEAPTLDGMAADPASPITGDVVQISATAMDADIDGCGQDPTMAWSWSLGAMPAGSAAHLNDARAQDPSFVADIPGDYEVDLVVTDVTGRSSAQASLVVTVSDCGDASPVVDGVDVSPSTVHTGDAVHLAVAVSDADNDTCGLSQVLDVSSALMAQPAGSQATLEPAAGATPAFVADVPGDYVVRTTVTDGTGRSGFTDTTISVDGCGDATPSVTVDGPSADPAVGGLVTLTATADDADNDPLGCNLGQTLDLISWFVSAPAGSHASLAPAAGGSPAFVADVSGSYVVRTRVSDSTGRSSTTDTTVKVSTCGEAAPSVTSLPTSPPVGGYYVGRPVSLTFTASDADNDTCGMRQDLVVTTALVAGPSGSTAALSPTTGLLTGFTPDMAGSYTVRATVTDGTGRSGHVDVIVSVNDCGAAAPTVAMDAMTPSGRAPYTGEPVAITWKASDTDNTTCGLGQDLVVTSELVGAPAGSLATLSPSTGLATGFTPDMPGSYTVRATVTDSTGLSGFVDVPISVDTCGDQAPVAMAEVVSPEPTAASGTVSVHVESGVPVQLSAQASYDPDAQNGCPNGALTYDWRFTSVPAGSQSTFNDPTLIEPSFDPDVPGAYEIDLAVSDGMYTSHAMLDIVVDPALLLRTASGYTVTFLAGGSGLWDRPYGVTEDDRGNIYVVQNKGDRITVTTPDGQATSTVSVGGYAQSPQDIVYDPTFDDFLVTSQGNLNSVFALEKDGQQALYLPNDRVKRPTGIALYDRVVVIGDYEADRVRTYDADDRSGDARSYLSSNFGDNLRRPWGVWGISGGTMWALNSGWNDDLVRSDGQILAHIFDQSKDLALDNSGDLVVTDSGAGAVYTVANCNNPGGNGCSYQLVAWGPWEPAGVWVEDANNVIVTDSAGNGLYRITGPF